MGDIIMIGTLAAYVVPMAGLGALLGALNGDWLSGAKKGGIVGVLMYAGTTLFLGSFY